MEKIRRILSGAWFVSKMAVIFAFIIYYAGLMVLVMNGPNWFSGFIFSWIVRFRHQPGIISGVVLVWALLLIIIVVEGVIEFGRDEDKERYDLENHIV